MLNPRGRKNRNNRGGYQTGLLGGESKEDFEDFEEVKPQLSSSSRIYRLIKDPKKREELVWLINILAFWILLLLEYRDLEKAYANQPAGEGKTAMIAANTFFGAGKTWANYFAWSVALHYVVQFFQTFDEPSLMETIQEMRLTIINIQSKQDAALELKRKNPRDVQDEEKEISEINHKITILDKKVDSLHSHIQEMGIDTQNISFQSDRTATLFATRSNGNGNGNGGGIQIEAGRIQQADTLLMRDEYKTLLVQTQKSYIKNATPPPLASQEVAPNRYNIAYTVSLIAAMFANTKDQFISSDTCKTALTILIAIANQVKEANPSAAKPNFDITKELLSKAYIKPGMRFDDIKESKDLVDFAVQELNTPARTPSPRM